MRFPRCSGILLHPTSLPGLFGSGDLGPSAYHFVDWLVVASQSLWQMLPLGSPGLANSPYMCLSAFAGNSLLIDPMKLLSNGWLVKDDLLITRSLSERHIEFAEVIPIRMSFLEKASEFFFKYGNDIDRKNYEMFCNDNKSWLIRLCTLSGVEPQVWWSQVDYLGARDDSAKSRSASESFC